MTVRSNRLINKTFTDYLYCIVHKQRAKVAKLAYDCVINAPISKDYYTRRCYKITCVPCVQTQADCVHDDSWC